MHDLECFVSFERLRAIEMTEKFIRSQHHREKCLISPCIYDTLYAAGIVFQGRWGEIYILGEGTSQRIPHSLAEFRTSLGTRPSLSVLQVFFNALLALLPTPQLPEEITASGSEQTTILRVHIDASISTHFVKSLETLFGQLCLLKQHLIALLVWLANHHLIPANV